MLDRSKGEWSFYPSESYFFVDLDKSVMWVKIYCEVVVASLAAFRPEVK